MNDETPTTLELLAGVLIFVALIGLMWIVPG